MPDTHHLTDAPALARMKPGAYLINTSRGGLLDTPAVLDALTHAPNVLVTAHQGFFTREAMEQIARTTLNNLRFLEQNQLPPDNSLVV